MTTSDITKNLLPTLRSRLEYLDYLDRWSVGTVDELRAHMTPRALVKAFLLETSRFDGQRDAVSALSSASRTATSVDNTLHRLRWPGDDMDWALLDVEDERYPVLYTAVETKIASRRVDRLVTSSALLDRAWFAAPMFQRLWDIVLRTFPDYRFSQIVFQHESLYEALPDLSAIEPQTDDPSIDSDEASEEEEDALDLDEQPEERGDVERRQAKMRITERIGRLRGAIPAMREVYNPLASIVQLRMPATVKGGHDIYYDGRFTNRSESFTAFRQTVQTVSNIYRNSTEAAEASAWPRHSEGAADRFSAGAPIFLKFNDRLEPDTFDRWIAALRRKNNRFRLWANPIARGPGKVHLYAVDNHLWQPIDLEVTLTHMFGLLPAGTCGNTVHRLVTNIQRYIDPAVTTFIGDEPYQGFLERAAAA
jgi:hypothetical protein